MSVVTSCLIAQSCRADRTVLAGGALLKLPSLGKSGDISPGEWGASHVLRDSATPLKGKGLSVLLWVRQGTGPAQGEKLTFQSSCAVYPEYN